MISATNPDRLMELGDDLVKRDCDGVLLSGGAERSGGVQFSGFYNAIKYLKQKGLKVIVHTGLIDEETAVKLKESAVDQVLIDVIGDEDTINQVYHLDKSPEDFEKSLEYMKNTGLNIAPHIVIGLNYGKISGEYKAIEMISKVEPDVIVLVILSPMRQTPMFGVLLPSPEDIAKIAAVARIYNPNTPITLGCVRPSGSEKVRTERLLIRAGVNGITYPMDQTIEFSESLGLKSEFKQTCCSLLTI
jgi:uncharacterized radical SAM superfamily protein